MNASKARQLTNRSSVISELKWIYEAIESRAKNGESSYKILAIAIPRKCIDFLKEEDGYQVEYVTDGYTGPIKEYILRW